MWKEKEERRGERGRKTERKTGRERERERERGVCFTVHVGGRDCRREA